MVVPQGEGSSAGVQGYCYPLCHVQGALPAPESYPVQTTNDAEQKAWPGLFKACAGLFI